jgi:AcrR family transcriptional regulator
VYSNFRGKDDLFLAVLEAEARRPELRRQVAEQHERLLDTVGGLLEEWTVRWDVEFKLPAREVVRGVYAISRGMGLEALLADEPGATGTEQFEEMFLAYAMGLIRARTAAEAPGKERLP